MGISSAGRPWTNFSKPRSSGTWKSKVYVPLGIQEISMRPWPSRRVTGSIAIFCLGIVITPTAFVREGGRQAVAVESANRVGETFESRARSRRIRFQRQSRRWSIAPCRRSREPRRSARSTRCMARRRDAARAAASTRAGPSRPSARGAHLKIAVHHATPACQLPLDLTHVADPLAPQSEPTGAKQLPPVLSRLRSMKGLDRSAMRSTTRTSELRPRRRTMR